MTTKSAAHILSLLRIFFCILFSINTATTAGSSADRITNMKKRYNHKRLTAALLSLFLLCSCTAQTEGTDSGKNMFKTHDNSQKKDKIPDIPDTEYYKGNISFDMTLSDGVKNIEMNVSRTDGLLKAEIKSPSELAGISVISDIGGVRLLSHECDLGISEEGGAAFKALFSALELNSEGAEITSDGEGGVLYKRTVGKHDITLCLNSDGTPSRIICSVEGMAREGKIENFKHS